jgi:hypothetical protein
MSDYLWDKRGEPDAEVARLEAMLGAFAHEPRRLELPAEAAVPEPRRPRLSPFASRLFATAALTAALVAASVLVASLILRARVADEDRRAAAPESSRPKAEARQEERPAPREAGRDTSGPAPSAGGVNDGGKVESAAAVNPPNFPRQRKTAQPSAVVKRQQKAPDAESATDATGARGGSTLEAMSTPKGASGLVENARLLTKEQLVYALRFTGAKLKDVREKAQKAEARP